MSQPYSTATLAHMCPTCHEPDKATSACSHCHSVFYCGRECQALDWKTHKTFCVNEEKHLATTRREKCLEIIKAHPNVILQFLISQSFVRRQSFLAAYDEKTEPRFVPFSSHEVLGRNGFEFTEKEYKALSHAVDRTVTFDSDEMHNNGIAVLYINGGKRTVYVIGSQETIQLAQSVKSIPESTLIMMMQQYVENKTKCWGPEQFKAMSGMFVRGDNLP